MLTLTCTLSRSRVAAHQGHDLDLLVRARAPAPPGSARRPPLCLLPVVDISGSMSGGKLAAVQVALRRLAAHLLPGDFLGLVAFSSQARVVVPVAELTEARRQEFLEATARLHTESDTNLAGGLTLAADTLGARGLPPGLRARVIALTDGLANEGPATTPEELRALVREKFGAVTLSAFGYGADCDQVLLGDLAAAGGGSFAAITCEDDVLGAFGRELGGLLSTCASDLRVRVVPLAGAPVEERLGDVLYLGETSTVVKLAVPARGVCTGAVAATVHVSWRNAAGSAREAGLPVVLDYVPAEEADANDDPTVARARDRRTLHEAQQAAEELVRQGDIAQAHQRLAAALRLLRDPQLAAFAADQLLPHYRDLGSWREGTGRRSSTSAALKGRRSLLNDEVVGACFDAAPSEAEKEMEASFRRPEPRPARSRPSKKKP